MYHISVDDGCGDFETLNNNPDKIGTITVPGNARYIITVGSVDDYDTLSSFSSWGPTTYDSSYAQESPFGAKLMFEVVHQNA